MYLADVFTVSANLAGIPAISIPCGFANGLPIGLQLQGPAFGEAKLLQAAHQYQLNSDWHLRRPRTVTPNAEYEVIVGLEIHVQLANRDQTVLWVRDKVRGRSEHTLTCLVCTGMPGALPVLNERALELAIKAGLALNCSIQRNTKWDRKNYFYP